MTKQLVILSDDEIGKLYGLPKFDGDARLKYFDLDQCEKSALNTFHRVFAKVYFILQLGYFKAKQLFYVFDLESVEVDARYVCEHYFPQHILKFKGRVSKPTRLAQQKVILGLKGYKVTNGEIRATLLAKAEGFAKLHSKPIFIFRELLNYLELNRMVLPRYSSMQKDIIAQALNNERRRLESAMYQILGPGDLQKLQRLLEDRSTGGNYLLTWLQQEPSSFKYYQMRAQVLRKQEMEIIHKLSVKLIPHLNISNENVRYYASLAEHYSVYKLNRMKGNIVHVYLICFAYTRYSQINDTLIEAFEHYVRFYEKEADKWSKDTIYKYRLEGTRELIKVPKVLGLFTDEQIEDSVLFGSVRKAAFRILNKSRFGILGDYIKNTKLDKKELKRNYYETIQQKISMNLRFLFLHLQLEGMTGNMEIIQAIDHAKSILLKGKTFIRIPISEIPCGFIPPHLRRYFYKDGVLQIKRYEFLMLQTIRNRIDSGDIYVPDSFTFKSFDQDLIPEQYWQDNKGTILEDIDVPKLKQPINELLEELKRKVERKFKKVDRSILKGENKYVKVSGKKADGSTKWQLEYPRAKENVGHTLFRQFPSINIAGLMNMVNEHTGFLDEFSHILGKEATNGTPHNQLIAAILALGTNHGIGKMAQISDMTTYQLNAAVQNLIRNETLENANVIIVNAASRLPMFQHYNIEEGVIHSSSDGQKFGTHFDNINSRYSPKYYGLGMGICDYTNVANNVPINAKIIGAHEHESYYVFDLLKNNKTDVSPEIHSTDTDGTNRVNFAIPDFFGYQFAPRYASITSKAEMPYTFESPNSYRDDNLLKSKGKIDVRLIEEEWDNIQRIIASLALKTTSQSTIIKKLSSYTRNNRTHQALIEYDKILKTLYILEYIDSPSLRRNVQKALNRGEGYHQLKRHIFYVHGGKFRVHTVQEQQVIANCTHLIANVIIYYNTWLLSNLLGRYEKNGDGKALEKAKKISPIAWQHINVYGTYRFTAPPAPINVAELLENVKL